MDKKTDNLPGYLQGTKRQGQALGSSDLCKKLKKKYREGTPGTYM